MLLTSTSLKIKKTKTKNNKTPGEGRDPDDWLPRVQLKKEHSSGRLLMSNPESVAAFSDKFIVKAKFVADFLKHLEVMEFKKKKRIEERARESQKTKEKVYADYAWKDLCEDSTKLKQLRLPEQVPQAPWTTPTHQKP